MKIFRGLAVAIISLLFLVFFVGFYYHQPIPDSNYSPKADSLAQRMMEAVGHEAWLNTGAVTWNFADRHRFIWDRERGYALVEWDSKRAMIRLSDRKGSVYEKGRLLSGQEAEDVATQAWAHWANDSYWLNPISKLLDDGVELTVPKEGIGNKLMVQYTKGGLTPGDSYLWVLGDDGLPTSFQLWVKIIPIGGLSVSWEGWVETETGMKVATVHQLPFYELHLSEVRTAHSLLELTNGVDIFEPLNNL